MIHWHYLMWAAAVICFALALLGVFAAGMASRALTNEDFVFSRRCAIAGVILILITLAGCTTAPEPGIRVHTVEVPTPVPCVDENEVPVEPPLVGDQLNGNARHDLGIIAPSALELRIWGRTLRALIDPACLTVPDGG